MGLPLSMVLAIAQAGVLAIVLAVVPAMALAKP